jgi:hypothetical protein
MMTDSYSSNQFLNLPTVESGYNNPNPIARTADDNPEFLYPGKFMPNIYEAPKEVRQGNTNVIQGLTRLDVQRGFIRGIFPEIVQKINEKAQGNPKLGRDLKLKYRNLKPPVRRCFFQFNPSLILRSVQASSSTINTLLQDPTQLLQAIPGQASFEFQLLFNREREVAGQKYRQPSGGMVPTDNYRASLENYGAEGNSYNQNQVGDLGVLVDLYVLDSIIGQSITQDTMDTIRAYWQASKNLRATGEKDAQGKVINPYEKEDFFGGKDGKYKTGLENVLGNSAFLNPMPVRIVFSSLFMVEGFVTASSVAFHKFSREMVPTVCQVTLNVQALYIGFAKKNSYITQQLEDQITTDLENAGEDAENRKVIEKALKTNIQSRFSNMGFSFQRWWKSDAGGYLPNVGRQADPWTLNTWFAQIHRFNRLNNDAILDNISPGEPNPFNPGSWVVQEPIPYSLSTAYSERNNRSFRFWTTPVFKNLRRDTKITKISIDSVTLYFYDLGELRTSVKWATPNRLKTFAETGKIQGGVYKNLKPIASCSIQMIKENKVGDLPFNGGTLFDISTLDSDPLINASRNNPFERQWATSDMNGTFVKTRNLNKYFGDNVRVLAVQQITGYCAGAGGSDVSATVITSDVFDLDPNEEFSNSTKFNKDIYFGVYGKPDFDGVDYSKI